MASKKNRKYDIWEKTGGVCAHCGKSTNGLFMTIDHYVPKSMGGGFDHRNLFPLCKSCNNARATAPIIPETYYRFASKRSVEECREYEMELSRHTRTLADAVEEA